MEKMNVEANNIQPVIEPAIVTLEGCGHPAMIAKFPTGIDGNGRAETRLVSCPICQVTELTAQLNGKNARAPEKKFSIFFAVNKQNGDFLKIERFLRLRHRRRDVDVLKKTLGPRLYRRSIDVYNAILNANVASHTEPEMNKLFTEHLVIRQLDMTTGVFVDHTVDDVLRKFVPVRSRPARWSNERGARHIIDSQGTLVELGSKVVLLTKYEGKTQSFVGNVRLFSDKSIILSGSSRGRTVSHKVLRECGVVVTQD